MDPADSSTATLQTYIERAASLSQSTRISLGKGYSAALTDCLVPPTLHKDRTNRIIYHIGSFNPPHLGHLALIEHVTNNICRATVSSSESRTASNDRLSALTLVVIAHGESWIEQKLRKARRAAQRTGGTGQEEPYLHLKFSQRWQLLEKGISKDLVRKGVWLFPGDLGDWWHFHGRLVNICKQDHFELEFVELLGPDYVSWQKPQLSGQHGVVTSNICRTADFVCAKDQAELKPLNGFNAWTRVAADDQPDSQDLDGVWASTTWVCRHAKNNEYRIWFVQCDAPQLDANMSSTKLRQLIAEWTPAALEANIKQYAVSPDLLLRFLGKRRTQWSSTRPDG